MRENQISCKLHEPLLYKDFAAQELSFTDAAYFVERASSALRDMGIEPGECVGISTSNNIDLPLTIITIARAGAVAVPMNYMLKAGEMRYILDNCGAKTLIVDRGVCDGNIGKKEENPGIERWIMAGPSSDCGEGFASLDEAFSAADPEGPVVGQEPDDVVTLKPCAETTEEELLAWCREHIAGYKSPRAVRIVSPEEMPCRMTLKVRKLELRKRFGDIYTQEES